MFSELKTHGKQRMQSNYTKVAIVSFLIALIGISGFRISYNFEINSCTFQIPFSKIAINIPAFLAGSLGVIGTVIQIFFINVLEVGAAKFFLKNTYEQAEMDEVEVPFRNGRYSNYVLCMLIRDIVVVLGSLCFIIPGIIFSLQYSQLKYILAENPDLSYKEALKMSKEMMKGHKMDYLLFALSFVLWELLSALTLGILGLFYVNPYKNCSFAEFYLYVKNEYGAYDSMLFD